jgi:pyrroloquinoline quinone biosynthesis protein E
LTGDAGRTDPACALSPDHELLVGARGDAELAAPEFTYRQHSAAPSTIPALVSP